MGYHIFCYGISAEKVKNVIGEKDPDLFKAVLETDEFDLQPTLIGMRSSQFVGA